ncbi:hypothetical protein GCM10025734_81220 [Kitasatospora paranensis]|uniref:cytochrome P450 n=1 Tax=Kitasatospora paranensis TaxID=258053 RepID=UPI0031EE26A1
MDGARLRVLVRRSWAALERPAGAAGDLGAELRDDLLAFVAGLVVGGDSAFLRRLAADGWSSAQIAEELRAMVLAGWGSTTAAVLSAISLGVPPDAPTVAIDEALRLYPPSFMIARAVVEERAVLPFTVGDLVLVSPWLIHRHPRGWRSPDSYDPGRWAGTARPYWFLPFGIGPRRCPAARFARAQVSAALRLHRPAPCPRPGTLALVELRSPSLVPDWA